ncbi:hypothetical protein AGABI1DRAFT_95807, partial [Agaricus bisporus var. burnettii JB137-S8]
MPVQTRPKNKTTHPGLALRQLQLRREENKKTKEAREEAKAAKAKAHLRHIQEVSDLETSEAELYKSAANTTPNPSYPEIVPSTKKWQAAQKRTPKRSNAKSAAMSSEIDDSDVDEEPVRRKRSTQLRDAIEEMKVKSRDNGRQRVEHIARKSTKRGHEKDPNLFLSPVAKRKKPPQTPANKGPRQRVKRIVVVDTSDGEDETADKEYNDVGVPGGGAESAASEPELGQSDMALEFERDNVHDRDGGQNDQNEANFLGFWDEEQRIVEKDQWIGDRNVDVDDLNDVDYPHRGSSHNIDIDKIPGKETIYDNDDNGMQWNDDELEDAREVTRYQAYPPTSSVNHRTPKSWSARHEVEEFGADPSFTPRITNTNAKSGKGKARERHPPPQFDHTGEPWEVPPQEIEGSVFLEHDEREGDEHVHACFSPLKHGRRVDSQDLLAVSSGNGAAYQQHRHVRSNLSNPVGQVGDGISDEENEEMSDKFPSKPRRKRARPVTSDLPSELLQPANTWKDEIMPALFLWVAARKDVWNIPVKELVDALTAICRARVRKTYSLQRDGDTTGEDSVECRLLLKAMQRLSDWRSGLGFSAMWLVNNLVDEDNGLFADDEARVAWAGYMVDKYRFLYSSLGSHDMMPTGLFQSQVYVKTLALHLSKFATDDSAWVPGLTYETDNHEPWGAMALAAAALERAFCLWKDGDLSIGLVKRASLTKSRAITFMPKIGPKGVQTTYHTNFSELRWAKSTKKFYKTIEMRSRLAEEKKLDVSHILSHARIYVKPSKRGKSKSAVVTGGGEGDLDSDDSILGDTPKPIRTHHGSPSLSVQPIQKLSLHAPAPHGYQASRSSLPPSRMSSVSRSRLSSVAPGSRGLSVAPGSRGLSVAPGSRGSSVFSTRTSYRASPPFPTQ